MLERSIDPACEPYRHIIEAFRRDLADMEGGVYTPPDDGAEQPPRDIPALAPEPAPKPVGMTPQQAAAFDFIRQYIAEKHYSPSYEEIAAALGLRGKSGVHRIVHGLATRGRIRMMSSQNRSIQVVS